LLLGDPVPLELPAEPLPFDPPAVPPEPELADPFAWLADVACAEPGSALAIPRVPTTLIAPTPTVSAESRAIPRLRRAAAALDGWAG
jgi:hypothetical protein